MCGYCDITNASGDTNLPFPFNQDDLNSFVDRIWRGELSKLKLPKDVYMKTATNLSQAITTGFGKDIASVAFESPDYVMLKDLTDNIYMFSGAKTYQHVRATTDLLKDNDIKQSFYKFKAKASEVFTMYNEAHLQAEYQTAIGSSRMAAEWQRIEENKEVLPLLQYQTVGDARVRPTHASLDNIIRPVDDKFWSNYYPPNGWRCRCTVIQLEEGEVTDMRGFKKPNDVPEAFLMNSGKDKIVFSDKHPYFKVAKGDKTFAKKNFDLPIPK